MILKIILLCCVPFLVIYFYHIFFFQRGLNKHPVRYNYQKPFVSIVIAARNEENSIRYLLLSLLNQTYPKEMYEVIVADDDSTDSTSEVVKGFRDKFSNLKFITIKNRSQVKSPKKNALQQAIAKSAGEILLTTDADCIVGKNWISSHVLQFEDDVMMSVGFSETRVNWEEAKLCQKYEHFDFLILFLAAAGAISGGKYYSCSGQNLAYRKEAFRKVGGFESISHLVSGDDVNLMQLFRKSGFKIVFNFLPENYTKTRMVKNCFQLLNQRSRWASNLKWQIALNPAFFIYLISVMVVLSFPLLMAFYSIVIAALFVLVRGIIEYKYVSNGFLVFGIRKKKLKFYPVWFILQPIYILCVFFMGIMDIFSWKK